VGKPDPMLDEVPVAFVVAQNPSPSLAEAIHHICRQSLADFKRPRDVIFVEALPKGLLDKVLKKDLRARLLVP
jgi:crotonobetaine/carnitine-CoA ligase